MPDGTLHRRSSTEPHRRWTQSDITMLRDRIGTGADMAALTDLLQRSPGAVTLMMYRLRLRS